MKRLPMMIMTMWVMLSAVVGCEEKTVGGSGTYPSFEPSSEPPSELTESGNLILDLDIDSASQSLDAEARASFTTRAIDIRAFRSLAIFIAVDWPLRSDCYLSTQRSETFASPLVEDLRAELLFGSAVDQLYPSQRRFVISGKGILEVPDPPGDYMAIRFSEAPNDYDHALPSVPEPGSEAPTPEFPFCKGKLSVRVKGKVG